MRSALPAPPWVLFEDALAPAEVAASRLLTDCRGSAAAATRAELPAFFAAITAASAAGWHVALAYVIGFFIMLAISGWQPSPNHRPPVSAETQSLWQS